MIGGKAFQEEEWCKSIQDNLVGKQSYFHVTVGKLLANNPRCLTPCGAAFWEDWVCCSVCIAVLSLGLPWEKGGLLLLDHWVFFP